MLFYYLLHWLHWLPECVTSHAVYMLFREMHWVSRLGVPKMEVLTLYKLYMKGLFSGKLPGFLTISRGLFPQNPHGESFILVDPIQHIQSHVVQVVALWLSLWEIWGILQICFDVVPPMNYEETCIGCHGYGDMVFLVQKCMATWPLQYNNKTQVCVFFGAVDWFLWLY